MANLQLFVFNFRVKLHILKPKEDNNMYFGEIFKN